MERKPLLILGAGSFAREVTDIAADLGWPVVGYCVSLGRAGYDLLGRRVLDVEKIGELDPGEILVVGAMVSTARRDFILRVEQLGFEFATLVHPSASVSQTATLGRGVVVNRGAVISRDARIGRHVVVNRSASLGHGVVLGAYCSVGPGAVLAGEVQVGDGALLGMNCSVLERRRIGAGAIVGAGAVVTRDVPEGVKVTGVPARACDGVEA